MTTGSSLSRYTQDQILNWLKGTTFAAAPATVYLAAYTVAPTDASAGTEVTTSGTAYARQAITLSAITDESPDSYITNSAQINFPAATANYGTVVGYAVCDALTTGNQLLLATLDLSGNAISVVINTGNQLVVQANSLKILLD